MTYWSFLLTCTVHTDQFLTQSDPTKADVATQSGDKIWSMSHACNFSIILVAMSPCSSGEQSLHDHVSYMKEVDFNIRIAYWHYEAVIVQESSEFSLPLFFHTTPPLFFLQRCFPWPLTAVSELVLFLNQEDPLYCICVERIHCACFLPVFRCCWLACFILNLLLVVALTHIAWRTYSVIRLESFCCPNPLPHPH